MDDKPENIGEYPSRIAAAFRAIEVLNVATYVPPACDGSPPSHRKMSAHEQSLWDCAMESLRLYISGEMDYGDASVKRFEAPMNDKADVSGETKVA